MNERDIRRALGGESKATFDDLRRRLDADRSGPCDRLAPDVTALATGTPEPEAERHAAECARCRDRADAARDVWRSLGWPASRARFVDLKRRLLDRLPFRFPRVAAAALLAAAVALAYARPPEAAVAGGAGLGDRLEREGLDLRSIARLGTVQAARTLIAIGGPHVEPLLLGMMGRNREVDTVIASALTGGRAGPVHPADLVRFWRPDLLPALIDAAPPGSASAIVPALFDPRLAARATRALERLPHHEAEAALELAGIGATPEEAGEFAERGVAVPAAMAAAARSDAHRTRCFWSAVTGADGLEFLLAAAGTPVLREDAFTFLDLLPDRLVAEACRKALLDPALAAGAARAAARLGDLSLVRPLMRAANHPPPGMGSAGLEGTMISARSETLSSLCLRAVERLTGTVRDPDVH